MSSPQHIVEKPGFPRYGGHEIKGTRDTERARLGVPRTRKSGTEDTKVVHLLNTGRGLRAGSTYSSSYSSKEDSKRLPPPCGKRPNRHRKRLLFPAFSRRALVADDDEKRGVPHFLKENHGPTLIAADLPIPIGERSLAPLNRATATIGREPG